MQEKIITISAKTLFNLALLILGAWLLWFIRDIVFIFFVALLLSLLIEPFANWLSLRNIPRALSVLIVVILFFGLLSAILSFLVPVIAEQSKGLFTNIGMLWEHMISAEGMVREFLVRFGALEAVIDFSKTFEPDVSLTARGLFSTVSGLITHVFAFVVVIVLTFYLVAQKGVVQHCFQLFTPDHYRAFIAQLVSRIENKLGYWLRGQLLLSIMIAVLVYVGLLILGVPYALLLGVFAGVMELIPYVGPVLAAIPAIFVTFAQTPDQPIRALMVLVVFVVIQQFENHVLVPKVMQKAVGINPVISILSMMIGVKLAGVLGVLLAIPAATVILVCVQSFEEKHAREHMNQ